MLSPKHYLLSEWANLERTLRETLRYRYTENSTAAFFQECAERLQFLKGLIDQTPEDDTDEILEFTLQVGSLSDLITRIERSHLEEFSWPFARSLQRTYSHICTGTTPEEKSPHFFFMAEGGPSNYAVIPERNVPSLSRRRILTVIFPRTLKESVLLHAILGHEMGHAAIAAHEALMEAMMAELIEGSPIANPKDFHDWATGTLKTRGDETEDELVELSVSWAEEFLCDLFGLITIGPAFLPAFQSVISVYALQIESDSISSHPLYASRMAALYHAATCLGLIYSESEPYGIGVFTRRLDNIFAGDSVHTLSQLAILDKSRIISVAKKLDSFVRSYNGLAFPLIPADLLPQMLDSIKADVPPAACYPAANLSDTSRAQPIAPIEIDFRHILLGGWIHWSGLDLDAIDSPVDTFGDINHLASHAILQQEGIRYWNGLRVEE